MLIGAPLLISGIELAWLGGSFYYVLAGAAVVASGVLLWLGRMLGAWIYGGMFIGTLVWSLWEVGFQGWALMPRLLMWIVLGVWLLTPQVRRSLR